MIITADEFKANCEKYLDITAHSGEEIFITYNGKAIAKLSDPQISAVDSISGILRGLPDDYDMERIKEERFNQE